jgi:hypothetical protein
MNAAAQFGEQAEVIPVHHFVRGRLVAGSDVRHRSRDLGADFVTPAIALDEIVTPRAETAPLA